MADWAVEQADVLGWCAGYRGAKFHASLGDWPYELSFMGKRWDASGVSFQVETWQAIAEHILPGGFLFAFGGSRTYHRLAVAAEDAGLIVHPALVWLNGQGFPKATRIDTQIDKAAGRAGRNTVELKQEIRKRYEATGLTLQEFNEACGFEASGYLRESSTWANVLPSREKWQRIKEVINCDSSLDSLFDEAEREVIGKSQWTNSAHHFVPGENHRERVHLDTTAPATPLAQTWAGHRYGLQALKPCAEFILVAQKPYDGKPVDCITATGAGALNIDGGRIATGDKLTGSGSPPLKFGGANGRPFHETAEPRGCNQHPQGRWPANVVLSHIAPRPCPDCDGAGCDRCGDGWLPGCRRRGTRRIISNGRENKAAHNAGPGYEGGWEQGRRSWQADPDGTEVVDDWECIEGCPVKALGEMSGESSSKLRYSDGSGTMASWRRLEGRVDQPVGDNYQLTRTFGDSGTAARFYYQADWSYEIAEQLANVTPFYYCAKAGRRERDAGLDGLPLRTRNRVNPGGLEHEPRWAPVQMRNPHPTVKPISLTQWLATLLLPPDAYAPRRLLVPFAGSGSEMAGALLAGWDEIVGVEMDADYCAIARARLAWWADQARWGCHDVETLLANWEPGEDGGEPQQLEIWSRNGTR